MTGDPSGDVERGSAQQDDVRFASGAEEMLGWLEHIAEEVNSGDDVEQILANIVSAVVRYSPWNQCWVGWIDPALDRVTITFHAGFDPDAAAKFDEWPLEGSPSEHAIETEAPVMIADVVNQAAFEYSRQQAPAAGWGSALFIPIRVADAWTVVAVFHEEAREFDALEQGLARIVASFAATALRNIIQRRGEVEAERVVNAQLSELNRTISVQNSVLQRLAAAHEQFQQLQLRKAGIMALSDVISTLLVTPVIVLDRFFEILSETGISMDDAQTLARRVASHDGRALFPRAGDHPAVVNLDGTELLIGHAADGNDTLGFVLALRSEAAFDETDTRVVELACGTFTLDVLRHRTEVEAEVRLHRDFGDALASAGAGSTLSQRAALLGIRATQENQVLRVLIAGVEPELGRRDAYEVALLMRKRLQEVHRDAVVTSLGAGEFAVIVPRASVTSRGLATVTAAVRKSIADGLFALRGFDDPVSVAIGVGTAATDVDGLQASNSEAVRALTVLRSVGASNDDLEIGDAGSFALIASVGADDRVPFVDRYLTPLVEYDGRRNSGLIETLRTYFAEVGSVQRTADALFLHISTVRYRLSRIEEIANISLRNEEDRLCLQIAMRLAGFAHSLPRADD